MHAHADALEKQRTAYSTEAQKYKDALQRNETMLPFIEAAGRNCVRLAKGDPAEIPGARGEKDTPVMI